MRKIIPGALIVCLILSVSWSQGKNQPQQDILIVDVAHGSVGRCCAECPANWRTFDRLETPCHAERPDTPHFWPSC